MDAAFLDLTVRRMRLLDKRRSPLMRSSSGTFRTSSDARTS